jgi:hypothetical protein
MTIVIQGQSYLFRPFFKKLTFLISLPVHAPDEGRRGEGPGKFSK